MHGRNCGPTPCIHVYGHMHTCILQFKPCASIYFTCKIIRLILFQITHVPRKAVRVQSPPKLSRYPVALLPGQYSDFYRRLDIR